MFNKRMFKKINDKKVLHKIGKRWVVVSAVLLGLLGGGTVVTHAASVAPARTANANVTKSTQMQVARQAPKAVTNQTMKLGAANSQAASSKAMLGGYDPSESYFNSYTYVSDLASAKSTLNSDYDYVASADNNPVLRRNTTYKDEVDEDLQLVGTTKGYVDDNPVPKSLSVDLSGAQEYTNDASNVMTSMTNGNLYNSSNFESMELAASNAYGYINSVANSPEVQEDPGIREVLDKDDMIANSELGIIGIDSGELSRDPEYAQQAQSLASEASNLFTSASYNDKYNTSDYNSSEAESMSLSEQNAEENSAAEAQSYMESSLAAQSSANPDVYYSFIPPSYEDAYNSSAQSSDSDVTSTSAELIQSEMSHSHRRASKYLSSANFKGLSRSHRSVTTLKRVRAYKRTRRGRYVHTKFIRPNTKLMVKRVLRRGRTVRLELTNGLLITANKHFVTITKVAKRHIRRNKRTTKRNAKLSRYTKALRKSNRVLRRGYRRVNRYTYREAKKFTRANSAKKRAYRKFMRKRTTRNRKSLRRAQINLNNLVNALLK